MLFRSENGLSFQQLWVKRNRHSRPEDFNASIVPMGTIKNKKHNSGSTPVPSVVRYHTISSWTYCQLHRWSFWLKVEICSPSSRSCSCEPDRMFDTGVIVSSLVVFLFSSCDPWNEQIQYNHERKRSAPLYTAFSLPIGRSQE